MAKFKLIISDPSTGKSSVNEVEGARAQALIGRSLGELIDGSTLGIAQGKVLISGGCDKNGIPMRGDVHGSAKKYIVISTGPGFKPTRHGERRRKLVRGRSISDDTYQVNFTLKLEGQQEKAPKGETPPSHTSSEDKEAKPKGAKKVKETKATALKSKETK
ncbi:MAG TPA: 30S ribosomal protein S6e [Candidatus Saccharimonadales bacterium]|nr:30S ribosomal protein S6e [Candidatus Saccharimonadales bacterium]